MLDKGKTWMVLLSLLCMVLCCGCSHKSKSKEVIPVSADYKHYNSVDELAQEADYIFHGKVTEKAYEWRVISRPAAELYLNPEDVPPEEEELVTVYTVQVIDSYLNTAEAGDTIEVLMRGGETDTAIYLYEGTPQLLVEDEYVFFLSKSSFFENTGWPLNPTQAIYDAEGTQPFEMLEN